MTTLINTLNYKKSNLETILKKINLKNDSNFDNYTSKELKRCSMIIKQIKTIDFQLNEYRTSLLKVS